jgi:acyl-CoA thioesterase FadM
MYVWFRLIRVGAVALFRKKLGLLDESVVSFCVSPFDLDGYLHMNNGRYLTIMDVGRLDCFLRNGVVGVSLRRRWRPVVASATFRFRKELSLFSTFRLHTRLLCWEGNWLFVKSFFEKAGSVAGSGLIKMVVLGSEGQKVAVSDLVHAVGYSVESPPEPPEVSAWQKWERIGI